QMGQVTANYQDDKGNELADPVVQVLKVGSTYKTEQKKIVGYKFVKTTGEPATGTVGAVTAAGASAQKAKFSDTAKSTATAAGQTVNYIYSKIPAPVDPDKPTTITTITKTITKYLPKTGEQQLAVLGIVGVLVLATAAYLKFRKKA
ncbi:MucBP domain-containing protein, partial [Lactobacillus sp. YT155]|uniref:MucBP domain-containing protein n=1 Tax=Lactobacillus sp. YT155 TaxID=3060955 RepID=UPI00265F4763